MKDVLRLTSPMTTSSLKAWHVRESEYLISKSFTSQSALETAAVYGLQGQGRISAPILASPLDTNYSFVLLHVEQPDVVSYAEQDIC
jgi:hypothetical protein